MRYSIRTLLLVSTVVAVACAGFVVSTPGWAIFFFTAALVVTLSSIVAAFVRRGPAQAYWIGFAVFASGYFLLSFFFDGMREYHPNANQFQEPQLLTTHLLMRAYEYAVKLRPELAQQAPTSTRSNRNFGGGQIGVYQFGGRTYVIHRSGADFAQIGHSLFTLLFGVAGGWIGNICYRRNLRDPCVARPAEEAP